MKPTKCIIVEDEKPAQGVLESYIEKVPNLELLETFTNALAAIELLKTRKVELIFLDINLPQISGLDFLKTLEHAPQIIITTAYSNYALEGYELNVLDYLLKPISFERFLKAVNKVHRPRTKIDREEHKREVIENGYTFEKADNTLYKIEYDKIHYIESDRDYVNVVTREKKYVFRQPLKYWELKLPQNNFMRVHKSFIINMNEIVHVYGNSIQIVDKTIPIGRNYKTDFMEKINNIS